MVDASSDDDESPAKVPMLQELLDSELFGERGEAWFAAQAVLLWLLVFSPRRLDEVGHCGVAVLA